jgi:hypothetical protein
MENTGMGKTYTNRTQLLLLVFVLVVIWGLFAWLTHSYVVSFRHQSFDFYPRWHGARVMLEGENPYSEAVNRAILEAMHWPQFVRYQHNFLYPATITYQLIPFWLLPFDISVSIWSGLQLLITIVLPFIVFALLDWQPRLGIIAVISFVGAFIFRHAMHNFLFGQFVTFTLFCLVMVWAMLRLEQPWLAAIALVLGAIRPEGIIMMAAMLLYLLVTRRYKIILYWLGMMGALFLLSVLQIGFWIPDMMESVLGYRECCIYTYPPAVLGHPIFGTLFTALILLWGYWMLRQIWQLPESSRIPWILAVLITVLLLVFVQSKDYTLVYSLLPAWIIIWASRGSWWSIFAVLLLQTSSWFYYLAYGDSLIGTSGRFMEQIITPLALLILLTIVWAQWKQNQMQTKNQPNSIKSG